MKTKLFFLIFLGILNLNAQTTHDLIWERDFLSPQSDLTIEVGDTVRWTWTDENHTVENVPGSSVETFNSGFLGPIGSVWSYTFTVVGANDYFCGIHGADNMSGTITVEDTLGIEEEELNSFKVVFNSFEKLVTVKLPQNLDDGFIHVYDITGKRAISINFKNQSSIEVNVSALKNGIYIFSLESSLIKQSKQFLKY